MDGTATGLLATVRTLPGHVVSTTVPWWSGGCFFGTWEDSSGSGRRRAGKVESASRAKVREGPPSALPQSCLPTAWPRNALGEPTARLKVSLQREAVAALAAVQASIHFKGLLLNF